MISVPSTVELASSVATKKGTWVPLGPGTVSAYPARWRGARRGQEGRVAQQRQPSWEVPQLGSSSNCQIRGGNVRSIGCRGLALAGHVLHTGKPLPALTRVCARLGVCGIDQPACVRVVAALGVTGPILHAVNCSSGHTAGGGRQQSAEPLAVSRAVLCIAQRLLPARAAPTPAREQCPPQPSPAAHYSTRTRAGKCRTAAR